MDRQNFLFLLFFCILCFSVVARTDVIAEDRQLEKARKIFDQAEREYAGLGQYKTARRLYRDLLEAYPENLLGNLAPRAYYRIGLTFLAWMQPDSAGVAFRKAASFSDSELASYIQMGMDKARGLGARVDTPDHLSASKMVPEGDSRLQSGPYWMVQVGAFKGKENAGRLQKRLEELDFQAQVERRSGSRWLVVLVGPFSDRAAATKAKKRLLDRAKIRDSLIIQRP
ncbi:MAG: SPOR domain-containing protein [bacterium]|nr:SPOR domain-containing protein [bacterium]